MQLQKLNHIHELTESFGLTLNESEVYVYLLQSGLSSGNQIYTNLGLDKSSFYRAINSLVEKNLAYRIGEERNAQFGPNPKEELLSLADQKVSQIAQQKDQLNELLTSLDSYAKDKYQKNVTIFEGKDGYKRFLESRLIEGTTIREIGAQDDIVQYFDSLQSYEDYMYNQHIPKRISQNIFLKGLAPNHNKKYQLEKSEVKWMKEVRLLPKNFSVNALMCSWDKSLGFSSFQSGAIICVRIQDPLMTSLFNQMFDLLFDQLPINNEENNEI